MPGAASVAAPAPGRFRLKPKITLGDDEPEVILDSPDSGPVPLAADESVIIPRLKLKVVPPITSYPAGESTPDTNHAPSSFVVTTDAPMISDGRETGGLPSAENPSAMLTVPGEMPLVDCVSTPIAETASTPIARATPPPLPTPPPLVVKSVKPKATTSSFRLLILGCLVLLLVGGGAGTYFFLMQDEPPPPPPLVRRAPVTPVPKPAPAAPAVVPPVPSLPTPELAGLDPLPPAPGSPKPEAAVVAKPTKAPVVPVMTPAFRLWLEGVRINGVTASAGSVPRVIINGRLVRPGDTIDSTEGIVFESVDTEKKCVMFKNRAGFVAAKPY